MLPEFSSLGEFVGWLATVPGAMGAIGFFFAYVLERFSFWHSVAKDLKAAILVVLAYGVSYGAQYLLTQPLIVGNEKLNQLFLMLVFYLSSQVAYKKYFKV